MSQKYSRRKYLLMKFFMGGAPLSVAVEEVASKEAANPDWDMDEERTWEGWSRGCSAS